jgi:DNA-binding transcriptional MerR regulator
MQQQKNRMNKRKFRIGELAKKLKVKKFVIRFWEKEFELESSRSDGGQRFYSQDDLKTFSTIKDLLYNQKFTITGAKKRLQFILNKNENTEEFSPATKAYEEQEIQQTHGNESEKETVIIKCTEEKAVSQIPQEFFDKLNILKEKLRKIKEKLN